MPRQLIPFALACLAALLLPIQNVAAESALPEHDVVHPQVMKDAADQVAKAKLGALSPFTPAPKRAVRGPAAPSASNAGLQREVFGFALASSLSDPSIGYPSWNFSLVSTVAFFGLHVQGDGSFAADSGWNVWNSSQLTGLMNAAHSKGARVVLTIILQDFSSGTPAMCAGLANAQNTVNQTAAQVAAKGVDGVNVDYEGLNGTCPNGQSARSMMTGFMQKLRAALPNSYLSVDTYASSAGDPYGFFDVGALNAFADSFVVMAYDLEYSNYSSAPANCRSFCLGPTAPLAAYRYNDQGITNEYLAAVPAGKVVLGIPYYGRKACVASPTPNQYPTSGVVADTYLDASTESGYAGVSNFQPHRDGNDPSGEERWDTWYNGSLRCTRELYWDDIWSLGHKYDLVNRAGLRGVGIWNLNYGGGATELWNDLASHFTQIPGKPTDVSACAGDTFATVNWTAPPAASPITGYTITASPGGATVSVGGAASWAVVRGLSNGTSYSFTVTATNAYGAGPTSDASNSVTPRPLAGPWPGQYHALNPTRVLDSRDGTGGIRTLAPFQAVDLQVAGTAGLPSSGVTGAVMNLTVTNPRAPGFITVYPSGACRPNASSLNFVPGQTVPNLVPATIGAGGRVTLFNGSASTVDLVADLAGWVEAGANGGAGRYRPVVPARILDTRSGLGAPQAQLGSGQELKLQVAGRGGVPASGAGGVVLNVTITKPNASSYLTVYPDGTQRPLASSLNFVPGQTVPNRVYVRLGTSGAVTLFNLHGATDVVVDVGGWFTDGSDPAAAGGLYTGTQPLRLVDTRDGTGGFSGPVVAHQPISVPIAGQPGVAAMDAATPPRAVVLNITVTGPTDAGYLTAYPDAGAPPLASDLNFVIGQTVPNLVVVKVGDDGKVAILNSTGRTHVIVDLVGWYG